MYILSDPLDHLLLARGGHDLVEHSLLGSPRLPEEVWT